MKILHTIGSLAHNSGGPSQSVSLTLQGLWDKHIAAEILAYNCLPGDSNVIENGLTHFVNPPKEQKFLYAKSFKNALTNLSDFQIYHIQGLWQYPNYITAKLARKYNKPYLITPRGMLYPQAINGNKTWLKKILLQTHLLNDLNSAASVQVTCVEEMQYARDLGVRSPIAIIPNPVETALLLDRKIIQPNKFRVGYLGRIHPRKKVDVLIKAWHKLKLNDQDHELLIIGDGDKNYVDTLKILVKSLNLNNVNFTGFLKGEEKNLALQSLTALAAPSDFENFGMIVAEALSLGVPVMASKGMPWQELASWECGWWIENDEKSLSETILKAKDLSSISREQMGLNGKKLILSQYTKSKVAEKLVQLYAWILNNEEKPEFVFLK